MSMTCDGCELNECQSCPSVSGMADTIRRGMVIAADLSVQQGADWYQEMLLRSTDYDD